MNNRSLWYFIRNYRFKSIFLRNLIIILSLIIAPIIAMSWIVYQQMNTVVEDEITSINLNTLIRVRDTFDAVFQNANRLAAQLSFQQDVEGFFLTQQLQHTRINQIHDMIRLLVTTNEYIDSIYIFAELDQKLITDQVLTHFSQSDDKTWYEFYRRAETGRSFMIERRRNERYPYYLTLIHPVYLGQDKLGAVIVNINIEDLRTLIGSRGGNSPEQIYMLDRQGNILFNQNIYLFQKNILEVEDLEFTPADNYIGSVIEKTNRHSYILSGVTSGIYDWTFISVLPLKAYEQKRIHLSRFLIAFFSSGVVVAMVVSFIISVRTFKPIKHILANMDKPDQLPEREDDVYKNELLYINAYIAKTKQSNIILEQELKERMILLHEAQTTALQAQMNPHFLSNTLETMKWLAMGLTGGENKVSDMAVSLSELLRLSLGAESRIIAIRKEIELSKYYLDIMSARYQKTLHVHWHVDERLLEYLTIQLSLQPLIENAIRHGIKPKRLKGSIDIVVESAGPDIRCTVKDDGVGMNQEQLAQLRAYLDQKFNLRSKHVGIRNVNQRIKLIFGARYGLSIHSEPDVGTTVSFLIPKVEKLDQEPYS